jgi:hypothetical protein
MSYEERMQKALDEIGSSLEPNYATIAKKYKLERSTLSRRARGKTTSRAEFLSEVKQCLTNAQERVLINQINRLTERGIPPTSQMVKNFAEEIIGREVGKNWVSQFCRRHQSELKSLYLRNIDNLRVKGEYGPTYKLFYDLVKCFFALLYCTTNEVITDASLSLVAQRPRRPQYYCRKCLQLGREGLLDRVT